MVDALNLKTDRRPSSLTVVTPKSAASARASANVISVVPAGRIHITPEGTTMMVLTPTQNGSAYGWDRMRLRGACPNGAFVTSRATR